jgi:ABC-type sugar transport system permease subunit
MSRSIVSTSPRARKKISLLNPVFLFSFPAVILLLIFSILPVVMTLVFAWTDQRLIPVPQLPTEFIGLRNFSRLLENELFAPALRNTVLVTLLVVPLQVFLGLMLALLVNQRLPGMPIFRTLYFLPATTSVLVVSLVASRMLVPGGLLEQFLNAIGFGLLPAIDWNSEQNRLAQLVLWMVWQGTGLQMLVFLAALQAIPKELRQASSLDGANAWQHFRFVTWGLLRNASVFAFVSAILRAAQLFDQQYITFQDQPSLVFVVYMETLRLFQVGSASAVALIVSIIVALGFTVQWWLLRERPSQIPRPKETWIERISRNLNAPFNRIKPNAMQIKFFGLARVALTYAIACVFALFFAAPMMQIFSTAISLSTMPFDLETKSWRSLFPILPVGFDLLLNAFQNPEIVQGLKNSLLTAAFLLPLNILVNGTFAYALARFKFRARAPLLFMVIVLNFVPFVAQAVPLVLIVKQLEWIDAPQTQIVPFVASALSVFLFHQFFLNFPRELEDAAKVDGASWWQVFWRVVMPLSLPVCATVTLLTFLASWNNFFWPIMTTFDPAFMPLALSITFGSIDEWDAMIVTLPTLIMFVVFQRWFIRSITSGAINE